MTAGTANLVIEAEAGFPITFTYCSSGSAPGVPGPPIDVTGWTAKMSFRSSYGDGNALTLTSASGGGITVTGVDGAFAVLMTAAQTTQLPNQGVYDLLITPPGGQPIRLVEGKFEVAQAVTKAD